MTSPVFSMELGDITATLNILMKHGMTIEDMAEIRRNGVFAQRVSTYITTRGNVALPETLLDRLEYEVTVDHSRTLEDYRIAAGFERRFIDYSPVTDRKRSGFEKVIFVLTPSSTLPVDRPAADTLISMGLEAPETYELYAFAAAYPDVQRIVQVKSIGTHLANETSSHKPTPSLEGSQIGRRVSAYVGGFNNTRDSHLFYAAIRR